MLKAGFTIGQFPCLDKLWTNPATRNTKDFTDTRRRNT
jgi:hypothetical protein